MAKKEKKQERNRASTTPAVEGQCPVPTRLSYLVCIGVVLASLVLQWIMAAIGYKSLPAEIPSGWIGWAQPGGMLPSWMVFVAFPGAQIIILIISWLSTSIKDGERVMYSGRATSMILLSILFTTLQGSLFNIQQ